MEMHGTMGKLENETSSSSYYKLIFTDSADQRTNDWFLIGSPLSWLTILASYLYFVKVCGPKYMQDKEPYKLKRAIRIYNILQIAINIWLFREAIFIWSDYNWNCQPLDYSNSPRALRTAWACYVYFLNKIMDLSDTIFFIFRKKYNQVSFLHVFHHAMMVFGTWLTVKYFPGGHATFIGLLNTFVHILLYAYYYLAAFGPKVQKYLWWKRYLTRIQLIQFCLIFIHNSQLLVTSCEYPRWTILLTMPNVIFFYYLFNDFYKKSYTKPISKIENNNSQNAKAKNIKTK